jgi:3-isopropylmalate/(R)-2-methylmalate dehydratase small subunit
LPTDSYAPDTPLNIRRRHVPVGQHAHQFTDQVMPKQCLRRIDKAALAGGLLYDLRFDGHDRPCADCVLNQPAYAGAAVLIGGPNFGCGSSREHAVWGLQQFGVQVVMASSFGEIFYSNAMNHRLLLVILPEADVEKMLADAAGHATNRIRVDLATMTVHSASHSASFTLSARHRHLFLEGLDMIGASLLHRDAILAFAAAHWERLVTVERICSAHPPSLLRVP